MKTPNLIVGLIVTAASLAGCSEFSTFPEPDNTVYDQAIFIEHMEGAPEAEPGMITSASVGNAYWAVSDTAVILYTSVSQTSNELIVTLPEGKSLVSQSPLQLGFLRVRLNGGSGDRYYVSGSGLIEIQSLDSVTHMASGRYAAFYEEYERDSYYSGYTSWRSIGSKTINGTFRDVKVSWHESSMKATVVKYKASQPPIFDFDSQALNSADNFTSDLKISSDIQVGTGRQYGTTGSLRLVRSPLNKSQGTHTFTLHLDDQSCTISSGPLCQDAAETSCLSYRYYPTGSYDESFAPEMTANDSRNILSITSWDRNERFRKSWISGEFTCMMRDPLTGMWYLATGTFSDVPVSH